MVIKVNYLLKVKSILALILKATHTVTCPLLRWSRSRRDFCPTAFQLVLTQLWAGRSPWQHSAHGQVLLTDWLTTPPPTTPHRGFQRPGSRENGWKRPPGGARLKASPHHWKLRGRFSDVMLSFPTASRVWWRFTHLTQMSKSTNDGQKMSYLSSDNSLFVSVSGTQEQKNGIVAFLMNLHVKWKKHHGFFHLQWWAGVPGFHPGLQPPEPIRR